MGTSSKMAIDDRDGPVDNDVAAGGGGGGAAEEDCLCRSSGLAAILPRSVIPSLPPSSLSNCLRMLSPDGREDPARPCGGGDGLVVVVVVVVGC